MANPNDYAINTAQFSLQLLRGQMVNYLTTGEYTGSLSLNEFILGRPAQSEQSTLALPQGLAGDVLSRLVRTSSGALRLEASDMREKGFIVKTAEQAFEEVGAKLSEMQSLVGRAESAAARTDSLRKEYSSLAADIASIVTRSEHDGVNLLDGSTWAGEERVSSTDGYSTGKLRVSNGQASGAGNSSYSSGSSSSSGSSGSPGEVTLFSLSSFKETFQEQDLDNLPLTKSKLANAQSVVSSARNSYTARAGLYNTEASTLERQADILDQASQRVRSGNEQELKNVIVDLLLRDQGNIIQAAS